MISNKLIANKEVVIVEYAFDYVRKQGYDIKKPNVGLICKKILASLLFCIFTILTLPSVLAIDNVDLLDGYGSFDTSSQYNAWTKTSSGEGEFMHDLNNYYLGGGSLKGITDEGRNNEWSGSSSYDININEDVYIVELNCHIKTANDDAGLTSCHLDEVQLIQSNDNLTLSFAWQKKYGIDFPAFNIISINLIKPNLETISLWSNNDLVFNNWTSENVEIEEQIIPTPPKKKSIFYIDFSKSQNIFIMIVIFCLAGLLFFLNKPEFSAFILVIAGLVFLFSEINVILSAIVIMVGVILIFYYKGGRE